MTVEATAAGEQRTLLWGVSWSTYEALLSDLGDHGGRLAYDQGMLEIMSPSDTHERLKKLLARFIEAFTEELRIKICSTSALTLKSAELQKGAEADESYYIQNESLVRHKKIDLAIDPPPDLAIEVEISRSAINRLGISAALSVPEVWRYDGKKLRVFRLGDTGQYLESQQSAAFPMLPLAEVERFLDLRSSLDETELVITFRQWVRERYRKS